MYMGYISLEYNIDTGYYIGDSVGPFRAEHIVTIEIKESFFISVVVER